jgi:hypothetical protein
MAILAVCALAYGLAYLTVAAGRDLLPTSLTRRINRARPSLRLSSRFGVESSLREGDLDAGIHSVDRGDHRAG